MNYRYLTMAVLVSAASAVIADPIHPAGDAASNTLTIQAAIDDAVPTHGTVTLGPGTFQIDSQLMVTGGVTLVGQGWTNTVIRLAPLAIDDGISSPDTRCAYLDGGASIIGVTLTGGHTRGAWQPGAGVLIKDGTVSWCCVTNNQAGDTEYHQVTVNNIIGAGVSFAENGQGRIDHSIIAGNASYMNGGGSCHGGGIGVYRAGGMVEIDTCLVCGNIAPGGCGGGIYVESGSPDGIVRIIDTTVAGNASSDKGGGIYLKSNTTQFENSIFAENTGADDVNGKGNWAFDATVDKAKAAAMFMHCFFGDGSAVLGETSVAATEADFVDSAHGDYHLQSDSQAAELAVQFDDRKLDLDGTPRRTPATAAGCYECASDDGAIRLGAIVTTVGTVSATVSGSIESLGRGKSATVTLRYGSSAEAMTLSATEDDVTSTFVFDLTDLEHATKYHYSLTVENDVWRSKTVSGTFVTQYNPARPLMPSDDPSANVISLNAAFASAAETEPKGTVTLGEGVFKLDAQLLIAGGITVIGRGWEKTVLKQVGEGAHMRVAKISDGSTLSGVTVTGGHTRGRSDEGSAQGAGLLVSNGHVSWCCVSNNVVGDAVFRQQTVNNAKGAGISISQGSIDHTIVSFNEAYCNGGGANPGGGIGIDNGSATPVTIDTCLVYSNRTQGVGTSPCGGAGIYLLAYSKVQSATIVNTTVYGNVSDGYGAGLFCEYGSINAGNGAAPAIINCVFADNVSGLDGETNPNVFISKDHGYDRADAASFNNLFGTEDEKLGTDAIVGVPGFRNPKRANFHPAAGSPMIDFADPEKMLSDVDLGGKQRGKKPEIGCYEFLSGALTVRIR